MSLSPYGASAVQTGSLRKGIPIMLLGGVLAWVSGQSWSSGRGVDDGFQLLMAFATLVSVAVPAQMITGPRGRAWMLATAGMAGITVPWFFDLAVEQQGQGMLLPSAVVAVASWLLTFLACRATRSVLRRTQSG